MRKILLLFGGVMFLLSGWSQSADKGRINFYAGGGGAYYKMTSNININETGAGVPYQVRFGLDVNTHKQVSLGVELWSQNFLTDDSTKIKTVDSGMAGLNLKYNFMNREKSVAYVGTSLGVFGLTYEVTDSLDNVGALRASGIYNSLYLGYNKYFGNHFGFYVKTGLMNQPMQMEYLTFNGEDVAFWGDHPVQDWKIIARGAFLNLGLVIKLNNKAGGEKS